MRFPVNNPAREFLLMRADAISLTEAANNVMPTKQAGELQPEFQAMMDRFRGELLQMQNA